MGKWLKKTINLILIASISYGCARGLSNTPVPRGNEIQKVELALPTATLEETIMATAIPIPYDKIWIEEHGFEQSVFEGYTAEEIQAYVEMSDNQVRALEHIIMIKPDIFDEKLTPDSLLALWDNYLSIFNLETQKVILKSSVSPIEYIDSSVIVFGSSYNLSPTYLAHVWDQLVEDFGLNVMTIFDNSKPGTDLYVKAEREHDEADEYNDILSITFEDRSKEIEDFRSTELASLNELSVRKLREYYENNPVPQIARDFSHDQVLETIIAAEKGNTGPITFYFLPHMDLKKSRIVYDDVNNTWTNYSYREMFPKRLLEALEGRHLNLIFSTCPVEFVKGLQGYLDYRNISYTMLFGDNEGDIHRQLPINGIANATDIIISAKFNTLEGPGFPAIVYGDYELVSEGKLEGEFVSVEHNGNFFYYTLSRFFENYDPINEENLDEFKQWPEEIVTYIVAEPSADGLNPYNVDFELAFETSEYLRDYKEDILIFGMGLERME